MDFSAKLTAAWDKNDSLLCIGLDPDLSKLPATVLDSPTPLLAFNTAIIAATADTVCAYKPNTAFYEALGGPGLEQLRQTVRYIHDNYPEILVIGDAKRADIGNTNEAYATELFEYLEMDAVTIHPYLGQEAIQPFLDHRDKGCIVLCRTSNPGAGEFQDLQSNGLALYQHVAKQVKEAWNTNDNCMLVVGATYPEEMQQLRQLVGETMPFLVPGIGAQGGDIAATIGAGQNSRGSGLIINSGRAILYADSGPDFAAAARTEAIRTHDEINKYRRR